MDQDALVNDRVASGEAVVRALDDAGYPVAAAFWNYFGELEAWRLVIVPRDMRGEGVRDELLNIGRILRQSGTRFDVSDIKVSPPGNALIRALSKFVRAEGLNGIRASRNWIDGVYIEDAYIYRMAA
jgi:hypothetical protein